MMIFDPQHASHLSFQDRQKENGTAAGQPFIFMTLVLDTYALDVMQRRHSCIRSTCNNAIVRTAGNNWTIYEPCGLALRMYDYRGKRCVARTPRIGLLAPSAACNYSRGHCISNPRLIVKIALGIQQKDNTGEGNSGGSICDPFYAFPCAFIN